MHILDLCNELPIKAFGPGETILQEGHDTGVLYVLARGAVEILKGDFQINTVSEPGSIFGEVSVLLGLPHMATVKTLEESSFYVADDACAFLRSHPDITFHLAKLLARRLHSVTSYLVDLKAQFEESEDHLGMVDEVLETLVHSQDEGHTPGSDRDPDPTID